MHSENFQNTFSFVNSNWKIHRFLYRKMLLCVNGYRKMMFLVSFIHQGALYWITHIFSHHIAHRNTKLFITHAGLLSTQESVWHGVPMLGIPIFADQFLVWRSRNAFHKIVFDVTGYLIIEHWQIHTQGNCWTYPVEGPIRRQSIQTYKEDHHRSELHREYWSCFKCVSRSEGISTGACHLVDWMGSSKSGCQTFDKRWFKFRFHSIAVNWCIRCNFCCDFTCTLSVEATYVLCYEICKELCDGW